MPSPPIHFLRLVLCCSLLIATACHANAARKTLSKQTQTLQSTDAQKQYQYTQGMNLQAQVPFDAEPLIDSIQQNATINEQQG